MTTETQEQIRLFDWSIAERERFPELKLMYHIPNEGKRNAKNAAILKKMGLKRGVPDVHLPVARGPYHSLYIEMKRVSDADLTEAQGWWMTQLRKEKNCAVVCYGWKSAAATIEWYLNLKHKGDAK